MCSNRLRKPVRRIILEVDELDFLSIHVAMSYRQLWRVLPDGDGNLAGRLIAEIVRGYMDLICEQEDDA
jgi:hypothetical protein